jgi:hypothetical protein
LTRHHSFRDADTSHSVLMVRRLALGAGFGQSALVECSFCGNSQEAQPDGRRVIGGPRGVAICSDCVRLCAEILEAKPPGETPPGVWTTTTHGSTSD